MQEFLETGACECSHCHVLQLGFKIYQMYEYTQHPNGGVSITTVQKNKHIQEINILF
jgi:hypothetical protein